MTRTNIIIPTETLEKAKNLYGSRGLSKQITKLIAEDIRQQEKEEAMAWIESHRPLMPEITDPVAWQKEQRALDEKRWEKLGI